MSPTESLVAFSWGLVGVLLLAVFVPYLRGKAQLVTGRNIMLLGGVNYVGLAGLKAGYAPREFRILEYTRNDYELFMLGAVTFFVTLLLVYHFVKFPRKIAGAFPRKWPPASTATLYLMLGIALVLSIGTLAPIPIQGVAQIINQAGNKGIVFGLVLAFVAWDRQKTNLFLLTVLIGLGLISLVMAINSGGGRRTFLGVVSAIPIAYYWLHLRSAPQVRTLAVLGIAGVFVLMLVGAYSQIRHSDRSTRRNLAQSIELVAKLPTKLLSAGEATSSIVGQNAAQTSLAAIHLYTTDHKPEPFHSVYFVSTIAIPRAFWPEKPVGLGYSLPKTARAKGTRATWGPGIVGHGFHEGGLHMLVFYGCLVGLALRYLDELLIRQYSNPYLLGAFATASGHMLGWTRGDIGTFTIQVLTSFATGYLLGLIGRLFFGSGTVYPPTSSSVYTNRNLFDRSVSGK